MDENVNMQVPLMNMIQTVTLSEPWDVDRRLEELQLGPKSRLLKVAAVAVSSGADATPFHPANAAGTLAYQFGTWALRDEFIGDVWSLDRPNGVEAIKNESTKVRVVFANVDVSCNDKLKPKPRSRKGAGAERVCDGNLFGDLPEFAPRQTEGWATYYLMVDVNGAVELTRPIIRKNTFTSYVERIYLSDGSNLDREPVVLDDGDRADDFDPLVVRK